MKHINIYLIRHGQSLGNAEGPDKIGQPNDSPLSDLGFKQAEALHTRLKREEIPFNHIFSSTFKRAIQTTQTVFPHLKGITTFHDDLVEYSPGDWRGKVRSEVFSDIKNVERIANLNMGFVFPNGESQHQVSRRMAVFIEKNIIYNPEYLELTKKDEKAHIGVVSHGISIKTFLQYVMGFDRSFVSKIRIENTSITKLKYHPNKGWFLRSLNDTAHLRA